MSIDSADLSPKISNEYDLETVIAANPGLLGEHLFIIGRQVPVANGRIDLLAIDARGRLWVLELKHGATTASVLGQVASYARSISLLDFRALKARVSPYWHHASVETAFEQHFDRQFPRRKPARFGLRSSRARSMRSQKERLQPSPDPPSPSKPSHTPSIADTSRSLSAVSTHLPTHHADPHNSSLLFQIAGGAHRLRARTKIFEHSGTRTRTPSCGTSCLQHLPISSTSTGNKKRQARDDTVGITTSATLERR